MGIVLEETYFDERKFDRRSTIPTLHEEYSVGIGAVQAFQLKPSCCRRQAHFVALDNAAFVFPAIDVAPEVPESVEDDWFVKH